MHGFNVWHIYGRCLSFPVHESHYRRSHLILSVEKGDHRYPLLSPTISPSDCHDHFRELFLYFSKEKERMRQTDISEKWSKWGRFLVAETKSPKMMIEWIIEEERERRRDRDLQQLFSTSLDSQKDHNKKIWGPFHFSLTPNGIEWEWSSTDVDRIRTTNVTEKSEMPARREERKWCRPKMILMTRITISDGQ